MRWLGLLVILTACQNLFKLEHVDNPAADAVRGDVPIPTGDAPSTPFCWNPALTGNDDGDAYVDGCDPCPGNPDMNPTDSDNDGVPDVCDPEVGHNKILAFYPLDRIEEWAPSGGTWTINGTDLVQSDPSAANALASFLTAAASNTWVQVDIVGPDQPTSANTVAGVYLATGGAATPFDGVMCDLIRSTTGPEVMLVPSYYSNGTEQVNSSVTVGTGTEVWVSARAIDGACVAYADHIVYRGSAPSGVDRSPLPVLHTSFSFGQFKSMTLFSSLP